jgi:tetratricopeptide (TPR) repeat protein
LTTGDVKERPVVAAASRKKEKDLPKRQPKAMTCVAFGDFRMRESLAPGRTAQEQRDMRDQARKAYQQALQLDPNCFEAHRGLARAAAADQQHDQAIRTFQSAVKIQPRDAATWFDLGMVHARKKEWDPAVAALVQAAELEPQNRQYQNMLGHCLARSGRVDDSLACFSRIVGEARAHYNVARMMHHLQRDDLCRSHLQVALEKEPNLSEAKDMLVRLDAGARGEVIQAKHDAEETR